MPVWSLRQFLDHRLSTFPMILSGTAPFATFRYTSSSSLKTHENTLELNAGCAWTGPSLCISYLEHNGAFRLSGKVVPFQHKLLIDVYYVLCLCHFLFISLHINSWCKHPLIHTLIYHQWTEYTVCCNLISAVAERADRKDHQCDFDGFCIILCTVFSHNRYREDD